MWKANTFVGKKNWVGKRNVIYFGPYSWIKRDQIIKKGISFKKIEVERVDKKSRSINTWNRKGG